MPENKKEMNSLKTQTATTHGGFQPMVTKWLRTSATRKNKPNVR